MSEVKKDDRLVELMTEFSEASNPKKEDKDDVFGQLGLDNRKMLSAIEEHRIEIEELKEKLNDVSGKLQEKANVELFDSPKVTASEITALESMITHHATQIDDLMDKQKMLKTDLERENKPKRGVVFGSIGWLLLLSTLLLWSVLGLFFWKYYGQSNINSTTELKKAKAKNLSKMAAQKDEFDDALSTNSQDIGSIDTQTAAGMADLINAEFEEKKELAAIAKQENLEKERLKEASSVGETLVKKTPVIPKGIKINSKPVSKKMASAFSKPTLKKSVVTFKTESIPSIKTKAKVATTPAVKIVKPSREKANEPAVSFGD